MRRDNHREGKGQQPIRVMIVDDHGIVRLGLKSLLLSIPDISIVGEASDGSQCMELIPAAKPDIVLMDVRLPGKSGIEVCHDITASFPDIKVIILTSYDRKEYVQEAASAGARGYILKEIKTDKLVDALTRVMQGEVVYDAVLTNSILADLNHLASEREQLKTLTQAEIQVLQLLSVGKTNKEIANHMFLSEKTIRNYVSNVLNKLDLNNRTEAAAFAYRHHLDNEGV